MKITDSTPSRTRTVLGETYSIPQPFTAEHFAGAEDLGVSAGGVAQQMNQVLAENIGNNVASRIRNADKNGTPRPTQADVDALVIAYDFTGARASTGTSGTLFDKLFYKNASAFIRKLIKRKGYRDLPAPVTVAKKDEPPKAGQISLEDFEAEVTRLIDGDGPWSEVEAFAQVRADLIEDTQTEEADVRKRQQAAESKLSGLGL